MSANSYLKKKKFFHLGIYEAIYELSILSTHFLLYFFVISTSLQRCFVVRTNCSEISPAFFRLQRKVIFTVRKCNFNLSNLINIILNIINIILISSFRFFFQINKKHLIGVHIFWPNFVNCSSSNNFRTTKVSFPVGYGIVNK